MKKSILIIITSLMIGSCGLVKYSVNSGIERIVFQKEENDGRKLYAVLFKDGTALDFMYIEEINHGIKTGKWEYNEAR
jgi:hypothetical protein